MTIIKQGSENPKWYNDWITPSNIISLVALVVSLITAINTLPLQFNQDIRDKQAQLRELMIKLYDLDKEFIEITSIKQTSTTNILPQENLSILNSKRQIYLNSAEIIASQIPKYVTVAEYMTLATQRYRDANYGLAKEYFEKAIEVSKQAPETLASITNQHYALTNLATFYYNKHNFRNYEKGKKYFSEAVQLLQNREDDASFYTLGQTYMNWCLLTLTMESQSESIPLCERARKYYSKLPELFVPSKQELIKLLDYRIEQYLKKSSEELENFRPFSDSRERLK